MLVDVSMDDLPKLINVWEASVRATHDFLDEANITRLKSLIYNTYFDAVQLMCYKNNEGEVLGFSGVSDSKIEMLFISPDAQGLGLGSLLCKHAIASQQVTSVDVNEQNPRAITFYEKMGFTKVGRSDVDGEGKPYPLIHMQLQAGVHDAEI